LIGRWLNWAAGFCCLIGWAVAAIAQPELAETEELLAISQAPEPVLAAPAGIPGMEAVRQAWNAPARSLEQRVSRTRRTALEIGIWNLDAAARSLLGPPDSRPSVDQARAAITLAPDLPMARMALARALWLQESSPVAAIRAAWGALEAIPRHLEASVWFAGIGSYVLALALTCGGLLCLAISAAVVSPHAAHDLGDVVSNEMPGFARVAMLAAVILIPFALGLGFVGAGLGLIALASLYGSSRQLWVLLMASGAIVAGLFPVAQLSGAALTAFSHDEVVDAAYSSTDGFVTPVDRLRLEQNEASDTLAVQALAVTERRDGNLAAADGHYQRILSEESGDQSVLNNAANVRLSLGHMELALDLYRRASEARESARVLFNLSQAYGAAFAVDDLTRTLAEAQRVDEHVVAELTRLQGSDEKGFTIDLPINRRILWERAYHGSAAGVMAREFRAGFAPGVLGTHWWHLAAAFAVVAIGARLASMRLRASHLCARCGRRLCPRCDPEFGGNETCEGCTRLFHQPETTDRSFRMARINALRRRDARLNRVATLVSILVPGYAGQFARRHVWSLVGSIAAALATAAIVFRNGIAMDPLVAGPAAPMFFGLIAAFSIAIHAIAVWTSLSSAERR